MGKTTAIESIYGYKATVIQVLVCIAANTALLPSGMTLGFTAVALPYMLLPNQELHVNKDEASWIASVAAIITPLGCLSSGPIIDHFGRRTGLLLLNIPAFLGWLCIAVKPSLTLMFLGRTLTGIACGISSTPASLYMAESSTPSLRGYLVTGTSIAISLGVAIVYIMGLIMRENWRLVAGLCSAFPIISIVSVFFLVPESPVWLIKEGKERKACESLQFLRGRVSAHVVQKELDDLIDKSKAKNKAVSLTNAIKAFSKPEAYKPFVLMNLFFLFQQLTGIFVVIFYAVDVVQETGIKTDPFVIAVYIGLTRLLFTIVAAWMSKRFGRRITAIISGIGMTISLLVLSTHLALTDSEKYDKTFEHPLESINATNMNLTNQTSNGLEEEVESRSLVPVISILIYILASTIGFLTLPWAMIGEVYPTQVRGIASGATTCVTYVVSFFIVKLYPKMLDTLNKHGVFYFYGSMALLGTVFVFFFLPETQGKTLAEIEEHFKRKTKRGTDVEELDNLQNNKMVLLKQDSEKEET